MTTPTPEVNPFADAADEGGDHELVKQALAGDRAALEALVERHQRWIYNVAFRMVMVPQDAEDVTQEIIVKVLTKLSTFDPSRTAFRTWLYRVVANHVTNMKQRGYEAAISRIEDYYSFVAKVPDQDPDSSPETQKVVADLKIGCVMGTFLCLERTQRLAFILAMAFDVSDVQGAEIMETSREAFRKLLSRARARLHEYVSGNCGLMNPDAPCQCSKKVRGFMASGAYSADRLTFIADAPTLAQIVGERVQRFDQEIYADWIRLVRAQPYYSAPQMTPWLRELVQKPEFKDVFAL